VIFFLALLAAIAALSFFIPSYILQGAIRMASPLLLAGIGGLFSQLAGVLNIALEGMMLFAAFFSIVGAMASGSVLVGTLLGVASSVALAALFATVSLRLKANIFFAGLATNLFAAGSTVLLQSYFFGGKGAITLTGIPKLAAVQIPCLRAIPFIGPVLSGHAIFVYLSWLAAVAALLVIRKTTLGLRIRSVGENADAFRSIGLRPDRYRGIAILFSGLTCGLAGAQLAFSTFTFAADMVNNRGWIGLVTIFLGGQNPAGVAAASLLFGATEQVSYVLQISGVGVPRQFLQILPYIATIAAMSASGLARKARSRVRRLDS
jgi:general nucleoside transport system permease protein